MKQLINHFEFLELFDPSIHQTIIDKCKEYKADYVVCFENQDLSSSECGRRTAMPVGENNTYKTLAKVKGKWLNDLPSQRQYAAYYISSDNLLRNKE